MESSAWPCPLPSLRGRGRVGTGALTRRRRDALSTAVTQAVPFPPLGSVSGLDFLNPSLGLERPSCLELWEAEDLDSMQAWPHTVTPG